MTLIDRDSVNSTLFSEAYNSTDLNFSELGTHDSVYKVKCEN